MERELPSPGEIKPLPLVIKTIKTETNNEVRMLTSNYRSPCGEDRNYSEDILYQLVPMVPEESVSASQILKKEVKTEPKNSSDNSEDMLPQPPMMKAEPVTSANVFMDLTKTEQTVVQDGENILQIKFEDNTVQSIPTDPSEMEEEEENGEDESNEPLPCGFCSLYFTLPSMLIKHREYCSSKQTTSTDQPTTEEENTNVLTTNDNIEKRRDAQNLEEHSGEDGVTTRKKSKEKNISREKSKDTQNVDEHSGEDGAKDTQNVDEHSGEENVVICIDDDLHSCIKCNFTTNNVNALAKHVEQHAFCHLHLCQFCDEYFFTMKGLLQHAKLHKEYFSCKLCGFNGNSKPHIVKHLTTHIKQTTYKCRICNYETALCDLFYDHTCTHFEVKEKKCLECNKIYKNVPQLMDHMEIHFNKKIYTCIECGASYNERYITTHMMTHAVDVVPFKCDLCDYRTKDYRKLIAHRRTHTGEKPYACSLCDFKTRHENTVKEHMKIHTGEKPFNCEICDFTCRTRNQLRNHVRHHVDDDRPVQCRACRKRFLSAFQRSKHKEFCTGRRRNLCNICGKFYSYDIAKAEHIRIHHNDEKDFECDTCGFKCKTRLSMIDHVSMHSGEKRYHCKICGYKTHRSGNIYKHNKIHTGEKPYKCSICDYKTANCSNFKTHKRMHERKLVK